ncbi:MAG TPA: hypothetical protein VFT15_10240 [Chitinophagaceae bacterium]|nr:hypothetical protein [Chitinophagaceae bacterium]
MKKIMIYFLLIAMPAASFCQKTNDSVPSVKTDYLTKSKNQKSAAWVLLGGGTALIGAGFLIGDSKNSTFDDAATGAILGGIGVLSAIGSIPLFIASGKNKRKALNMSANFRIENATNSYPAIALKINL